MYRMGLHQHIYCLQAISIDAWELFNYKRIGIIKLMNLCPILKPLYVVFGSPQKSTSKTFKCQRPFSFINMLVLYESKRICALAWLHKNCINQYSLRIRKFLTDSVLMK